jgi:Zn finger protein HypA/HybF involved in hydrogenase expression
MGNKAKIRCFVCQAVFKKKEGELACPKCQSKTVAKLSKKHGRDGGDGGGASLPCAF